MRYSLSDYILSVTLPSTLAATVLGSPNETLSIGGEQSYVGGITVSFSKNTWETTGDYTGSYVHVLNKDRTGTIQIDINQVSDAVTRLIRIFELYYSGNYDGCTLSVTDATDNKEVCRAESCLIQKIPDQQMSESPQDQQWVFTCGRITF